MAINTEDMEFLHTIKNRLEAGAKVTEIADELGIPHPTMYARIDRLGYEIATSRTLVPKPQAPELRPN